MKKLLVFCLMFLLAGVAAQAQSLSNKVARAVGNTMTPYTVDVYFLSRGYVPSSRHSGQEIKNPQLRCHAVVFTQQGALAIDGECWKKLQVAQRDGEILHMFVDLKKFGTYGSVEGTFDEDPYRGPTYGDAFYFSSDITEDVLSDSPESLFKPVTDPQHRVQYFTYRKQMVKPGSQVGNAIKNAYRKAQRKEFSDGELKAFFQKPSVKPTASYQTISDDVL